MENFEFTREEFLSGAIAGMLGTVAFGAFFAAVGNREVIEMAIPALYGIEGPAPLIGGAIHLFHGAVLGVAFALVISNTRYRDHLDQVLHSSAWGAGYGVLTTVILAAVLMPLWLAAVGFGGAPEAPNFNVNGLIGHVIYGVVLGVGYPLIKNLLE